MAEATRWVGEHEVAALLDLDVAVAALRRGFAAEGAGRARAMEKTMLGYDEHSTLHALGAVFSDDHIAGTKSWTHTPGGADPALLLFDTRTGALRAVIEAFALGQLRTAGTAALATDLLARPDATRMAVIGTGKQALAQVAAVAHVRPLEEVRAFSRDPDRRAEFAARVVDELGLPAVAAMSPAEAVDGVDIVTLVSRATSPVLEAAMVRPGMHINAVGAIDLGRQEFEPGLLRDCELVVTDSIAQVRSLSREFRSYYGPDEAWEQVRPLAEVVGAGDTSRDPSAVTLFKGMGSGVEDVALGVAVLDALADAGVTVPRRGRARVDLARPAPANLR